MEKFATFIMHNRHIAILMAGFFGIVALKVPPFAYLGAAIVALAALRRGWLEGLWIAMPAALLVAGGWQAFGSRPGLDFPLVYALWLPLPLATETLRRSSSQGLALLTIGLIVGSFVFAMHLAVGDVVAYWHEWLKRAVAAVPGATVKGFEDNDTLRLANGFIAMMYGFGLSFALLLGRWLQALAYNPGGFGPEFRELRLPRLLLPAIVAVLWAAGSWSRILAADLLMVAILLYFFVGMAVAHAVVHLKKASGLTLLPLYIALLYMPQLSLAAIAFVGALDAVVDLRARVAKP